MYLLEISWKGAVVMKIFILNENTGILLETVGDTQKDRFDPPAPISIESQFTGRIPLPVDTIKKRCLL